MGEFSRESETTEDGRIDSGSSRLIDFVLTRAKAQNLSVREIANICGIKRGRCANILHQNSEKRHPFRVNEIELILIAVKIDQIEAVLATEMLSSNSSIDEEGIHRVVSLLSEFVRGLPTRVADIVEHMQGLEYDDLKKEQGRWLQVAVCGILEGEFSDVVKRRNSRLKSSED